MEVADICNIISTIGFPIFVSCALMWYINKFTGQIQISLTEIAESLSLLTKMIGGEETDD